MTWVIAAPPLDGRPWSLDHDEFALGIAVAHEQNQLAFAYDLTLDEARRRAAVLEAIGDDWDPLHALAEEELAWDMLYSDLDDDQERIYAELVDAGVLPKRTVC